MANDDSGLTFLLVAQATHTLSLPLLVCSVFVSATSAPAGTLLVDQPADWLTYCCHNSSAQCWRSRRSFNYQAAGGVRGLLLNKECEGLVGGGGWSTGSCSANGAAFQLRCEAWPAARLGSSSSRSSCKARHEQSYRHSRKVKRPLDNNLQQQ